MLINNQDHRDRRCPNCNNEDGSATLQLDLDSETFAAIFNVGFVHLIMKGMESDDRQPTSSMSL